MKSIIINKAKESIQAIVPVSAIIVIISIILGVSGVALGEFLIGAALLIIGLILFSLGTETAMMPIATKIGGIITRKRKVWIVIAVGFIIGFLIAVAEPDLWVLAEQFPSIDFLTMVISISVGVGVFLVIGVLRIIFQLKYSLILIIFYSIALALSFIVDKGFVPVAFDAGGATTGPITVPFIMALGLGVAATGSERGSKDDSFGLVGLCAIGPIISVLILALFNDATYVESVSDITLGGYFLKYLVEIAIALLPFIIFFIIFQITAFKLTNKRVIKILVGFLYSYLGLVLFMVGANTGFISIGSWLGSTIARLDYNYLLIPIGMIFGYAIVTAEPSVTVLTKQVEEATAGAIPRKVLNIALAIGVSIGVGLAAVRVLTGLNILWIIIPAYVLAIAITFIVPKSFSAIAFDGGTSASGVMTATFLVPLATGAVTALGGNVLTDAFGMVCFVTISPIVTVQLLGLIYKFKARKQTLVQEEDDEILDLMEVKDEVVNDNN